MEISDDARAVVAAILAAVRITKQGTTHFASGRDAYREEWEKMFDRLKNPSSVEPLD